MSEYIIKTYQEEFIEDQVRIGTESTKNWLLFGQTPVDRLKEAYSQPDFDPETRLYCFKGEEMVGFLTSRIVPEQEDGKTIGTVSPPLVLEGHEEAFDLLLSKGVETLKKKGANILRFFANDTWGLSTKVPEKHGFEFKNHTAYLVSQKMSDISTIDVEEEVLLYDKERDLDELVEIFVNELGMTKEQAIQNFEVIDTAENILGHFIIRKDDKIAARTYAQIDPEQNVAYVGYIYATEDKYRQELVSKIVNECKEKEVAELKSFLFGGMMEKLDDYKAMGFEQESKSSMYEKEL
jgi:hypothetical protein